MHTFPEQKWEHQIKPDSKFLFYFVDILKFHSINQTTLSNNQKKKKKHKHHVFRKKMLYKIKQKIYIIYYSDKWQENIHAKKKMPQTSKKG